MNVRRVPKLLTLVAFGALVAAPMAISPARSVTDPGPPREIVRSLLFGSTLEDQGAGVATGTDGSVYLVGTTASRDYPAPEDRRFGPRGGTDVFVTKIDPGGATAWSAVVGGAGNDSAAGIAVDPTGAPVITGTASSADFPTTTGALKPCDASPAGFVIKIDPTGRALAFSTCLGAGSQSGAVTLDTAGRAYVVGSATANVPVTPASAYQAVPPGGGDAFLAVLQPTGTLLYGTYLGGAAADTGTGVAVGSDGTTWITGQTCSTDYPTNSAAQAAPGGKCDAFVTSLDPTKAGAAGLVSSTYLGGADDDAGAAVAVGIDGAPHVTGYARSDNFPVTAGAAQPTKGEGNCFIQGKGRAVSEQYVTPRNCSDAFVTKLTPTGSSLQYSTYLGGTGAPDPPKSFTRCLREGCNRGDDFGTAILVSTAGEAMVTGRTVSAALPTTPGALQSSYTATDCRNTLTAGQQYRSPQPCPDALFAVLGSGGSLDYSTYLGGNRGDSGTGVAKSPTGGAYVAGTTNSNDFPVLGAIQPDSTSSTEAFVTRVDRPASGTPLAVPAVEQMSARSGPTSGGTAVVISGRRLSAPSEVLFGDTPAAFSVNGAGAVVAIAPPHPAGRVGVSLVTSAGASLPGSASWFDYGEGGWSSAGTLSTARPGGHTATALADGRILVTGGCCVAGVPVASAEIFDPVTGRWSATASMGMARFDHTATLLPSGKVVVAGGIGPGLIGGIHGVTTSAELYDPTTGAWTPTGDLNGPCVVLPEGATNAGCGARYGHSATLLGDGTVLAVGGEGTNNGVYLAPVRYADLFFENLTDARTGRRGTWVPTAPLNDARAFHSATLLQPGRSAESCGLHCGKVFAAAGISNLFNQPRPEMYDPLTRRWIFTEFYPLNAPVYAFHSATAPGDGTVVFAGGNIGATGGGGVDTPRRESIVFDPSSAGLCGTCDPAANTYRPGQSMDLKRYGQAAVALPSGKILVAGGYNLGPLRSAEVYEPATSRWASAGSMGTARGTRDAAIPPDPLCPTNEEAQGICGGGAQGQPIFSTPGPTATLITGDLATCGTRCGTVLVVGGADAPTADLYTPPPTVTLVSPATAPLAGGEPVTITGTGLGNEPRTVGFGSAAVSCPGPDCSVLGNDTLRVTAPPAASASTVDVVVITAGGASEPGPGARLTYVPAAPAGTADAAPPAGSCPAPPAAGAGQAVYPSGYSLAGLPAGSVVAVRSPLYGWFDQGAGGTYTSQDPTSPVAAGRAYWAWSSCPFAGIINQAGATSTVNSTLSGYRASMVGNPSANSAATVTGHDFAVRWDPQLEGGAGGYILSGYREALGLRVGEGAWVFAYRTSPITLAAPR